MTEQKPMRKLMYAIMSVAWQAPRLYEGTWYRKRDAIDEIVDPTDERFII